MGVILHDADLLSNSISEEICKSLQVVTVNVLMKSRMRESRSYGSERTSHREVQFYSINKCEGEE